MGGRALEVEERGNACAGWEVDVVVVSNVFWGFWRWGGGKRERKTYRT